MNVASLPVSTFLGLSDKEEVLSDLLNKIVCGKYFTHSCPIEGTSMSGRILSTSHHPEMVPTTHPLSARKAARHLLILTREARYDPPENRRSAKYWEIRSAVIDGKPVAIAWAAWSPEATNLEEKSWAGQRMIV